MKASIKDKSVSLTDRELLIDEITILSTPFETLPVDLSKPELQINNATLFDLRPITLRHFKQKSIFKIQTMIVRAFREYFEAHNFVEIRTPKIVKEGAEGGANIFSLEYFGEKAYLTQSPQFYKEYMVGVYQRVFEVAPVFRAEKHNTSRHINEYISMDIEVGPIKNFQEIMQFEVGFLKHMVSKLKEECCYELQVLNVHLPLIEDIPALKFYEAKEILNKKYGIEGLEEDDLSPEEEVKLCEYIKDQTGSEFVFVTHYPKTKRPFYAKDSEENNLETESFDLLFRGVEITTGGQRIHHYEEILKKLEWKKLDADTFSFFTSLHKYGVIPHGGFGLGLERLTQKIIGLGNIKEASLFPRDITRLSP